MRFFLGDDLGAQHFTDQPNRAYHFYTFGATSFTQRLVASEQPALFLHRQCERHQINTAGLSVSRTQFDGIRDRFRL